MSPEVLRYMNNVLAEPVSNRRLKLHNKLIPVLLDDVQIAERLRLRDLAGEQMFPPTKKGKSERRLPSSKLARARRSRAHRYDPERDPQREH